MFSTSYEVQAWLPEFFILQKCYYVLECNVFIWKFNIVRAIVIYTETYFQLTEKYLVLILLHIPATKRGHF
jgi:hypothetical protein